MKCTSVARKAVFHNPLIEWCAIPAPERELGKFNRFQGLSGPAPVPDFLLHFLAARLVLPERARVTVVVSTMVALWPRPSCSFRSV